MPRKSTIIIRVLHRIALCKDTSTWCPMAGSMWLMTDDGWQRKSSYDVHLDGIECSLYITINYIIEMVNSSMFVET